MTATNARFRRLPLLCSVSLAFAVLVSARGATAAGGPTKDECVEAHSRGQDAREAGQLSLARRLFLTCAQASCPGLIQGDCARFSDELDRLQPTVTFVARDSAQTDLPDTTVYVDGVLVATRLDDGKTHDVDPGRHQVRFLNGGRELVQTMVINEGEKGRSVVGVFPAPRGRTVAVSGPAQPVEASRPVGPLLVAAAGGAVMVTGGVLMIVGLNKVPSSCNMSTRECAVPPGDPAFDEARSGVTLANVGLVMGVVGAAATVTGLVWYFVSPPRIAGASSQQGSGLTPWVSARGAGLSFSGAL